MTKTTAQQQQFSRSRRNSKRRNSSLKSDEIKKIRALTTSSTENSKNPIITELEGDMFDDAPDGTLLIHACNCLGSWGAGIAAEFKERYPAAFAKYHAHAIATDNDDLVGTALLIPPCEEPPTGIMDEPKPHHWIGCLFTSRKFGRGRDVPEQIIENTGPAMLDMLMQIAEDEQIKDDIVEMRMCKINAGLFNVPWEDSKAAIEQLEVDGVGVPLEITVYEREKTKTED